MSISNKNKTWNLKKIQYEICNKFLYRVTKKMTYINNEDLRDSWPVEVWLRIQTTVDTITIDDYRDWYDKKEFRENKFNEKDKTLIEYEKSWWRYPEFSKVTGISFAINDWPVQTLTWDEESLLKKLNDMFKELDEVEPMKPHILCGFNLYQHDVPYLWKRMVMNWIKPDHHLRLAKIPVYNINKYVRDLNQLWKQTGFSASLDLIIYNLLKEKAEWNPYASGNNEWMLDKTRQCWRKICNLFSN